MTRPQTLIERTWYGYGWRYWMLLPLTGVFALVVRFRRWCYATGIVKSQSVNAPVIVVGNISVGGTGKTPVTIWLTRRLAARGWHPGVISRGYGGRVGSRPVIATADSDPGVVGDEAIMMARQCECPVVVHPDRVAAGEKAIDVGADILIADDGLQHYRLKRDVEIAVIDADRRFGNGRLLPAGPLREPVSRLDNVDIVLMHRAAKPEPDTRVLRRESDPVAYDFWLNASAVVRLDHSEAGQLDEFSGQAVHAVAGIGHPERFFRMLESFHIKVHRHPLPDHAEIRPGDVRFDDDLAVLMTEKDAVKCTGLDTGNCWYVVVDADFDGRSDALVDDVVSRIDNGGVGTF